VCSSDLSDKKAQFKIDDNKNGKAIGVIDEESKIDDSGIQALQTLKEGTPPVIDNGPSEKVVPPQDTEKAISGEDLDKDEAAPVSTVPLFSEKAANETTDLLNKEISSYPQSFSCCPPPCLLQRDDRSSPGHRKLKILCRPAGV
jgi:hypothetical protein